VEAREDPAEHILDRRITIFRRTGPGSHRRTDERHALRLFEPDAVVADLVAAGLGRGAGRIPGGSAGDAAAGLVGLPGPQTWLNGIRAGSSRP
jgi:hypothetical protein